MCLMVRASTWAYRKVQGSPSYSELVFVFEDQFIRVRANILVICNGFGLGVRTVQLTRIVPSEDHSGWRRHDAACSVVRRHGVACRRPWAATTWSLEAGGESMRQYHAGVQCLMLTSGHSSVCTDSVLVHARRAHGTLCEPVRTRYTNTAG